MKKLLLLLILLILIFPPRAGANKLGIHIIDENDLNDAAEIVNRKEDWGYVTIVIRDDERDLARWQRAFDKMRELKIIPIIRIATHMEGGVWVKPRIKDAKSWAQFLNALRWPSNQKLVVLFNEPNHAKEWGGEINPQEFAEITRGYWEQFKRADESFAVLMAGLDQAAPNSRVTMDQELFMQKMFERDELIFTIFDALASHSYPNPGFSGKATDTGRGSIAGFNWELDLLKEFYGRNIPVYITETGWKKSRTLTDQKIAENYKYAFENVWNSENVKAVTPFILNYHGFPFDKFSWRDSTGMLVNYYDENNI